ncbi:protein N-terminal asparagine amidohydrolase isoform X1 [Aethina tumida]|uniref:protein N-terminal asparagine amidohydrolase isoform X1 n=1 Tax=Aethina tumida TaxID=116153 RepID=UPI002148C507|nr:protein N-terminal asparagine amidohydrolase isoform X1 [Aethina tumida]XP_049818871.1 protein N-terminal asparagine amidohydrolase isoform X1 [Aethina tumida]XP_049818872.1 protein N-terminal asparagine amidohydrolase isoform X1 [Aethina tumida]XP_049818873.1 protein N-terminal asparagine amidohydrolase isoform X1 [Aethina tumida]XP_049818874.1 protein N-terminal asparagine amidohydrolase isoform X1 [Aethina tumida]
MVLVLNGVLQEKCPADTQSLYHTHPVYRDTAGQLLNIPNKVIGPVGLLYVQQRELAATGPHDKSISILGSDDATTCLIVVVRHSGSGAVALAHLDGCGTDEAVCTMVQRVHELAIGYPEGRIELQLVGGFSDARNYSEELFFNVMNSFHKHPMEIDLTLACVGELNTTIRGSIHWPIVYGIGVNVKTGEIFPATFPDKGPDHSLRCARHLTGCDPRVLDIYDYNMGMLRIGPFNYEPLRGVDLWLEQSDEFILQHLSTSPEVEPPHFVMQIRTTLKYIQDNPFPAVTVFRDNRPHYFRRDEHSGIWIPVRF